jgi:hypothetical protein
MKVFSFGGGVQSTAALVLAAQGKIDYQTFLFCNVGEDSEHPDTLAYVHEVAMPYALAHGLELFELRKQRRDGTRDTVYQRLTRPGSRSIGIPVRMNGNGAPGRRSCTYDFKIAVVDKWLKEHTQAGHIQAMKEAVIRSYAIEKLDKETVKQILFTLDAFFKEHEPVATVGLGISLDEMQRVKSNMDADTCYWKVNAFPLLSDVPHPLTRQDCLNLIRRAGLPLPSKSACIFCPFHTLRRWQEMRLYEPEHFWYSAALETFINERRKALGYDPVWFCSKLKPLEEATTELEQGMLFDDREDVCESGYCFV